MVRLGYNILTSREIMLGENSFPLPQGGGRVGGGRRLALGGSRFKILVSSATLKAVPYDSKRYNDFTPVTRKDNTKIKNS
jgi:hypothetical protein